MFTEIILGFVVGGLVGMTGMGGGSMMTPILITFLHYEPAVAIGSDIIYAAVTKVAGSFAHLKQKTVDLTIVRRLAIGSVPGAIAGSLLADSIRDVVANADEYLKVAVGIAICLSAALLFTSMFYDVRNIKQRLHDFFGVERHVLGYTIGTGVFGGFLVGLTSVGAGSVMLVLMLIVYNTSTRKLVGTDIVHATILLFTAGIVHLYSGVVDWGLVAGLLIGSIPGVLIGSRMAHAVSRKALKTVLVAVLFFLGGQLIYRFFF
jgi:uncharacterized membrane protein YfcA